MQVGSQFSSFAQVEEAISSLFREHNHPLRKFNSQSVKEYNRRREKAGSDLRIHEDKKYAFVSYRLVPFDSLSPRLFERERERQSHCMLL